ncbi:MAG: ORF6N domain-containing protein [Solirubrobacterales bacterium]
MLDEDLTQLYGVEMRRLIEQVKRNVERFPVGLPVPNSVARRLRPWDRNL